MSSVLPQGLLTAVLMQALGFDSPGVYPAPEGQMRYRLICPESLCRRTGGVLYAYVALQPSLVLLKAKSRPKTSRRVFRIMRWEPNSVRHVTSAISTLSD